MNLIIRPIEPADVPAAQALYRAAVLALDSTHYNESIRTEWASRSDEEFIAKFLSRQRFVAEADGLMMGYVGYDADHAALTECYVAPTAQRRGVGERLVRHVLALAAHDYLASLSVLASKNAVSFYRALGFRTAHSQTLIMGDGQSLACVRMFVTLSRTTPD